MRTQLVYDGTFNGFLTAVFECYERKLTNAEVIRTSSYQPALDAVRLDVHTDEVKAQRVWTGLKRRLSVTKRNEVFKTFLSELPEMERLLSHFIKLVFSGSANAEDDFSNRLVVGVAKIARQVHREKHRMEAFVRFQRTKDDLYFTSVRPDFNVLPLIVAHFKDRYADQHWLIYDERRHYGILYDCNTCQVTEVHAAEEGEALSASLPANICHEDEVQYQRLWKDYFRSVNIGARKNKKLHLRHVPARYWRFLTEKKD